MGSNLDVFQNGYSSLPSVRPCENLLEFLEIKPTRMYPPPPSRLPHPQKFVTIMVFHTQLPAICLSDPLHVPINLGSTGLCSRNTDLGCHSLGLLVITLQPHLKKSLRFSLSSSFLVIWVGVTVSELFTFWS